MESNRDDALKCIYIAKRALGNGDVAKSERFLRKAQRLYPTKEAEELLTVVLASGAAKTNNGENGRRSNGTNSSPNSSSSSAAAAAAATATAAKAAAAGSEDDGGGVDDKDDDGSGGEVRHRKTETAEATAYTREQLEAVKRVRKCADYYEILGVSKEATESDLKKAYRKLALQFHPDKNKAPGASEAFKAIGNAFAILSDVEKRRQYDLYGPENQTQSRGNSHQGFYEYDPTHGFEADMTAEEIFNMFFGGGSVYVRRSGQGAGYTTRHFHHQRGRQGPAAGGVSAEHREANGYALIMQLMPIILIICLSLFSSLLVSDPLYSLQQSNKFNIKRTTSNLRVPYYVKENFHSEFTGSLRRLEASIEEDYLTSLRHACFKEKSYKENLLWQARYSGNSALLSRAHNYATPSCDQLEKIYSY